MDKKLSLWFIILAYSALYVLPDRRSWKEIVSTVSGVLRFLTLDRYKSFVESESVPIIFFADPIVLCSLCWSSLVTHPNQRVMGVQWTHRWWRCKGDQQQLWPVKLPYLSQEVQSLLSLLLDMGLCCGSLQVTRNCGSTIHMSFETWRCP